MPARLRGAPTGGTVEPEGYGDPVPADPPASDAAPAARNRLAALRALRNRQFRRFYAGSIVAQLGFWISHISFQDLMSDLTEDELWVALLFTTTFGPVILVGPIGGSLVDRFDRKRVLLASYLALACAAGFQLTLVATDIVTPLWLLFSGGIVGVTMAIMGPTIQTVTANLVEPSDLPSAISLQAMSANLSRVVGPAIAAPVIAADLFEVSWGTYLGTALFAMAVAATLTLRPYERDTEEMTLRQRVRSGLTHAQSRPPAVACLLLVATVSALVVAHISLMPAFTEDQLGRPKGDFVWMGVATGTGALFGAFMAGSFKRAATLRRGALLALPYCALLIAFSRTTSFGLAVAIQIVMGFFYIAAFTTMQVRVQELVDEEFRGRVMSLFQIAWGGIVPIGSLIMGLMAGKAGLDLGSADTMLIAGIVATVYAVTVAVRAPSRAAILAAA